MSKKSIHKGQSILFSATASAILVLGTLSILYVQPIYLKSKQGREVVKPQEPEPIVMLLPHQDDEMAMAGTVYHYLKTGHPVYSLLITDGAGSIVRHTLNGHTPDGKKLYSIVKKQFLLPKRFGYHELSPKDFSEARNREYLASMLTLGLLPDNIRFANPNEVEGSAEPIYQDGHTSQDQAYQAIKQIYQEVGDGAYVTRASTKGETDYLNVDHRAIEVALKAFPGISHKYYFSDKANPAIPYKLTEEELQIKKEALNEYKVWDPQQNRFAVGEHSVKFMLDFWKKNPHEYIIADPHNK